MQNVTLSLMHEQCRMHYGNTEIATAQQDLIGGSLLLSAGPQSAFLDKFQCVNVLCHIMVTKQLTCITHVEV